MSAAGKFELTEEAKREFLIQLHMDTRPDEFIATLRELLECFGIKVPAPTIQ